VLVALIAPGYFADQCLAVLYAVTFAAGYLLPRAGLCDVRGRSWFWPLEEKYSLDLGPAGGLFVGSLGFLALVLSIYLLADPFWRPSSFLLEQGSLMLAYLVSAHDLSNTSEYRGVTPLSTITFITFSRLSFARE
jgi:hypothetical protein